MSTRLYPIYQRGNPQLRVFLPNFWMKVIRPEVPLPPNVVTFHVSIQMTKADVKNYLEKIYNIEVADVRTRIALGKTRGDPGKGYIIKDDDRKLAYVKMHKHQSFEFPEIFPKKKDDETKSSMKSMDESKKTFMKFLERNKDRPALPGWYSL